MEMLVATAIFSIVALLVAFVFTRAARLTARENIILELERTAHFLINSVTDDAQASGVSGISYYHSASDPFDGCAISKIVDISNEGNLIWESDKTVYYKPTGSRVLTKALIRKSGLLKLPVPLTQAEVDSLTPTGSGVSHPMADNVLEFSVTNERPDGGGRVVNLSLELESAERAESTRRTYRIDKTIALLN